MRAKIIAVAATVLFLISFACSIVLLFEYNNLKTKAIAFQTTATNAQQTIQAFEKDSELRKENDTKIYLEDPNSYIANGITKFASKAEIYKKLEGTRKDGTSYTEYTYLLFETPKFINPETGDIVTIVAVKGETVHLTGISENNGPWYIGYFTCHTNGGNCLVDIKSTGILTKQ
jgi:hypothetical protein